MSYLVKTDMVLADPKHRRVLVTVAGQIGGGKTEVCRQIQERTGWRLISAGGILRRMAVERGMSLLDLNEYAKMDVSVDREIDGYLASLIDSPVSLVIDSRLAWHFIPDSIKVYLIVDQSTAAERVFKADRTDEDHASLAIACANNNQRQRLERERFLSLYGVDPARFTNYDLVIDSTTASPAEVASTVLNYVARTEGGSKEPECWLSPQRLIPTRSVHEPARQRAAASCVEVNAYDGAFLIVNGHAQVSVALKEGQSLIAARVSEAVNVPSPGISVVTEWENAHGFHFHHYPHWLEAGSSFTSA